MVDCDMLIPRPLRTEPGVGAFAITPSTRIAADPASESVRLYLQQTLRGSTGLPVRDADDRTHATDVIVLRVADDVDAATDADAAALPEGPGGDRSEAFRFVVTSDRVEV